MTTYQKLTSDYVRAWCEEWALHPASVEQALTTYALVENESEVLACLCGLARAQQYRLLRANRLTTPEAVITDSSALPTETNPDWNASTDEYLNRFS